MNRFQFVEAHKDAYGVKRLCKVIEIARSSFYAWLAAAPGRADREAADAALAARIVVLQDPQQGGIRRNRETDALGAADHRGPQRERARGGTREPQAGRSGDACASTRGDPAATTREDHRP